MPLSAGLDQMTLEEKVGQLLLVHFNGGEANDDAKKLIQELHVGGFIYYNWANGLHSPEQVKRLSSSLQKLASIPLLIAVDQEGGRVARLKEGFTSFPSNQKLAETGDPLLANRNAFAMGKELRAVGININLAPVVDIDSNPSNPVIGDRSYGKTPEVVIAFAKQALEGFHQAGMLTTLKHFPGHGDVDVDSHHDLPVVNKSLEELAKMELLPFTSLADQTDAVMTAHILVPAIDPNNCVTLSKKALTLLRNQIGFEGVIISDSLVMEGLFKKGYTIDEIAIRALAAGCDILLLGGKLLNESGRELTTKDVKRIHQSLMNAVKSGRISEERVNESVERILKLKTPSVIDGLSKWTIWTNPDRPVSPYSPYKSI